MSKEEVKTIENVLDCPEGISSKATMTTNSQVADSASKPTPSQGGNRPITLQELKHAINSTINHGNNIGNTKSGSDNAAKSRSGSENEDKFKGLSTAKELAGKVVTFKAAGTSMLQDFLLYFS